VCRRLRESPDLKAKAKVLLLFPHYEQDDITYFSYHKLGISPADTDDVK
jgi:hypothetical protein